ncbi:MAG: VWA domain-containing protein [Candidatus Thorarchaeota archaeon]
MLAILIWGLIRVKTVRQRIAAAFSLLVLMLVACLPMPVVAQTGLLEPSSISISGSILDNYANTTYEMSFDNTESSVSKEVSWFFGLQKGIRLSNVSVVMNGDIYWGKVIPEQEAITTYEESVEEGKTAVLVTRGPGGYYLNLNVANNTLAILRVFAEGLLVRSLGLYSLSIPILAEGSLQCDFAFDFTLISHYGGISGYSVVGLSGMTTTDLDEGVRLQYSANEVPIPDEISLTYVLERQIGGSQLLTYNNGSQNFFVYLLAPHITSVDERVPREYVFVLDRSGSMSGTKLQQAKIAFNAMIADLGPVDIFNVVSFSTEVHVLWAEPYSATTEHIATAQKYVNSLAADGSTNFYGASMDGLATFTGGSYAKVMLLLSDGLPTSGFTTFPQEILNAIEEANTLDVSISTVAFGYDADESLMSNVAAQNNGFFALIEPDEDAATSLMDFYKVWSTPIAGGFSITISGAVEYVSMMPLGSAPFFNGSEVVISGRYTTGISIETTVEYIEGAESYINSAIDGGPDNSHVELIWAQHRISWLLHIVNLEGQTESLRLQIMNLALQYGLVVDGYTGMILVAEQEAEHEETTLVTEDSYDPFAENQNPPPSYTSGGYTATRPAEAFAPAADLLYSGAMAGSAFGLLVIVVIFLIFRNKRRA